MTEFAYILIIIFEIIFALLAIWGLVVLEKRLCRCLETINYQAENIIGIIRCARFFLKKINEGIEKAQTFNFKEIKKAFVLVMDTVNFVLLLKSMKFSGAKSFNLRNIKKLVPFSLLKQLINAVRKYV